MSDGARNLWIAHKLDDRNFYDYTNLKQGFFNKSQDSRTREYTHKKKNILENNKK